jgi:hypothetical protein
MDVTRRDSRTVPVHDVDCRHNVPFQDVSILRNQRLHQRVVTSTSPNGSDRMNLQVWAESHVEEVLAAQDHYDVRIDDRFLEDRQEQNRAS